MQRRTAHQRRGRRGHPAPQRDHRRRAGQRIAGHRQRHPLLRVARHTQPRQRAHGRLHERQPGSGGHRGRHHYRDCRQDQQRHRGGARSATGSPAATTPSSTTAAPTTAKSVVREVRYSLDVPDAAEAGQAAQGAQSRLGPRRERRDTRRLRGRQRTGHPAATSHGSAASTAAPRPRPRPATAAARNPAQTRTPTRRSRPASSPSASARPARSRTPARNRPGRHGVRSRSMDVATQGRQP